MELVRASSYLFVKKGTVMSRLGTYLDSIRARDPAPHSRLEILTYPGVLALGMHRIAHRLYRARLFLLARMVNHTSRFLTAIVAAPLPMIPKHSSASAFSLAESSACAKECARAAGSDGRQSISAAVSAARRQYGPNCVGKRTCSP